MLTEEGESGDWQTKNLNVGLVLNSAERQNRDWKSHFHLAFQLQRNKQLDHTIELENSQKQIRTSCRHNPIGVIGLLNTLVMMKVTGRCKPTAIHSAQPTGF
jgi:hypothetical protein